MQQDAQPGDVARRPSLSIAYDLWVRSWEAALTALTIGTQNRALSMNEAALHRALIVSEREFVTKHLTLLIGRRAAGDA